MTKPAIAPNSKPKGRQNPEKDSTPNGICEKLKRLNYVDAHRTAGTLYLLDDTLEVKAV